MKKKFFTLCLTLVASAGIMFAQYPDAVKIGDLYYRLDGSNLTAEVTYETYDSGNYDELRTIDIPASIIHDNKTYKVTRIGEWAFCYSFAITSVTIPNSVTSIGEYAFYSCRGITSLTIPQSVTSIVGTTFGVSGIMSITVESGNPVYDSRDNCNAIIETATNTLVCGFKNTTIPNSVTSIGNFAFAYCLGLTSITIPNSVTSIGEAAFAENPDLTNITIPNNVISIGSSAFAACTGLTSVTIGSSVASIGDHAFFACQNVQSITNCATTPQVVTEDVLGGEGTYMPGMDKSTCVLYVPQESINAYKTADVWQDFSKILPIGAEGIANTTVDANQRAKIIRDGQVVIQQGGRTYSLQGIELR